MKEPSQLNSQPNNMRIIAKREPRQNEGPAEVSAGKCRPQFEYFALYVLPILFVMQTRQDLRTTRATHCAYVYV